MPGNAKRSWPLTRDAATVRTRAMAAPYKARMQAKRTRRVVQGDNAGMIFQRATQVALVTLVILAPASSFAQSNQSPSVILPPVIVTAQKEPADLKDVPASVTAVT